VSRAVSKPAKRSGVSALVVRRRRAGVGWRRTGSFIVGVVCSLCFGVGVVGRATVARRRGVVAVSCAC
jgi:hypothetical protein